MGEGSEGRLQQTPPPPRKAEEGSVRPSVQASGAGLLLSKARPPSRSHFKDDTKVFFAGGCSDLPPSRNACMPRGALLQPPPCSGWTWEGGGAAAAGLARPGPSLFYPPPPPPAWCCRRCRSSPSIPGSNCRERPSSGRRWAGRDVTGTGLRCAWLNERLPPARQRRRSRNTARASRPALIVPRFFLPRRVPSDSLLS